MSVPEPTDLVAGLDYLSTLAPEYVRAVPASDTDTVQDDAPMQYQFRASESGKWSNAMEGALHAIERERRLTLLALKRKGPGGSEIELVPQGQAVGEGIRRSGPDILTARVLALVAFLMMELEQCAR